LIGLEKRGDLAANKTKLPAARLQIVVFKDRSSFSGPIERSQNAVKARKAAATAINDVWHGKTLPALLCTL
jgi:dihydropteroate synthase